MAYLLQKKVVFLVHGYRPELEGWSKEVEMLVSSIEGSMVIDHGSEEGLIFSSKRFALVPGRISTALSFAMSLILAERTHLFCSMSDTFNLKAFIGKRAIATIIGPGDSYTPSDEHHHFDSIIVECKRDLDIYLKEGFDRGSVKLIYPGVPRSCLELTSNIDCTPRILVGSIPFAPGRIKERGIDLALKVARVAPELTFVFPCRTHAVADSIRNLANALELKNIEISCQIAKPSAILYQRIAVSCFLFTTLYRNKSCPNMALESIAQGVPVVSTKSVGISSELKEEGAGITSSTVPEEIAEDLRRAIEHRAQMTSKCMNLASKLFDATIFTKAYQALYSDS